MNTMRLLLEIGLHSENCVIIGSGILSALVIRSSNDIDVVVDEETYRTLASDNRFTAAQTHGRAILTDELFEIGTSWYVLGKDRDLEDLKKQSVVIDGVRYVTLAFLLAVKKSWITEDDVRQKDIDDVALIEDYLTQHNQ